VLDLGRALNMFDSQDRVPWTQIKTLAGLSGSTAHSDRISLFVALLNFTFGQGRSRRLLVVIGLASSTLSFRFTPFAALAIAWSVTALVRSVRASPELARSVTSLAAVLIALSSFLLVGLDRAV